MRVKFLPLLILASLGNLTTSLLLIGLSLRLRRWGQAVLFTVNLLMIFALQPIAMNSSKSLVLQTNPFPGPVPKNRFCETSHFSTGLEKAILRNEPISASSSKG